MTELSIVERLERLTKIESRRDVDIVQAVVRVLKYPAHQRLADELRTLIMKGNSQ